MANDDSPYFKAQEQEPDLPQIEVQKWPRVWLYSPQKNTEGNVTYVCGARIKVDKGGALHYTCVCGANFKRHPGFDNIRARHWVNEHMPHLPEEEQKETD